MTMAMYHFCFLCFIFNADSEGHLSLNVKAFTNGARRHYDYDLKAKFCFPSGGIVFAHAEGRDSTQDFVHHG